MKVQQRRNEGQDSLIPVHDQQQKTKTPQPELNGLHIQTPIVWPAFQEWNV